jgi:hypothetical protein
MARVQRTIKRRQFRFSLDPLDPVEGEALRQIDEIARQARERFGEISDDEADRYAFKQVLLGLLKDRPIELSLPPVASLARPAVAQPAATAVAVPPAAPISQPPVSPAERPVALDTTTPAQPAEKPAETAAPKSWAEELIQTPPRAPLALAGMTWRDDGSGDTN